LADLLLDSLCQEKELKNDIMEKEYPLVSVIIPVYNAYNSIAKTLQSVINQTYTNLEIVVVNDGSTDDSLDIIRKYAAEDPRIIVFNKQNEGLVQARKSGIDIATGKYIQYLDSDDIMHEDAITRLVNKAEETQADMVVAPFMFCYDGESYKSTFFDFVELSGVEFLKNILLKKAYWCVWSKFHLRSLYQNEIERPDISFGEDVVLSTQLLLYLQKVVSVDYIIIDYNFTNTSMSHPATFDDKKYGDFVNYTIWIENYIDKKGLREEMEEALAHFHLENAFRRIYWKRFADIRKDMKRLVNEIESYPCLINNLSKRERKIVNAYRVSGFWGDLKLRYYNMRHKL